jgi:hypothetical protein
MRMFEYKKVLIRDLERYSSLDVDKLNELGADRWELVTILGGMCIFKREKQVRGTRYC